MRRRDVLGSVAVLAAGLAGCQVSPTDADPTPSATSGSEDGCQAPAESLTALFPESDAYERQGTTTSDRVAAEEVARSAYALYEGPAGETYYFSVTVFESVRAASEEAADVDSQGGHSNSALVQAQTGRTVYFAAGPNETAVRSFVAASGLGRACIERFRLLTGTATP